jgi:hypothetical protein
VLSKFDDQFAFSAVPALQDYFGETITYKPRGGGSRTITGLVDRTDRNLLDGSDRAMVPTFTITVANLVTTGILATEINTGGDAISVAVRYGGTAVDRRITKVLETNGSSVTFEVT